MSAEVSLYVLSGPHKGSRFAFREQALIVVGRSRGAQLRLKGDPKISRHHFLLAIQPPRAVLLDLGSLNGTTVNAVRCGGRRRSETPEEGLRRPSPEVRLQEGDLIQAGDTLFVVAMDPDAAAGSDPGSDILWRDFTPPARRPADDTPPE